MKPAEPNPQHEEITPEHLSPVSCVLKSLEAPHTLHDAVWETEGVKDASAVLPA